MPGDIGRYQLLRVVATDGAAIVHEAVDTETRERVAVRRWPEDPALSADGRERMRATALQAAGLQHPGIVELHDFGWDGDGAYVVTAFLEGETLAQFLARAGRLPALQGLSLSLQLLAALAAAHERGLVHSALNPQNVLMGRNGQLKIAGFGWLAATASAGRRPGVFDIPAYMAPEQILGQPADCRADLYSAAVVAYELLTGSWPYQAHSAPRPARALRRELPAALDAVFERAQARNPQARHRNAAELAAALQAAFGMSVKDGAVVPVQPHRIVVRAQAPAPADVAPTPGFEEPEAGAPPAFRHRPRPRRAGVALVAGLSVAAVLGGLLVGVGVESMRAPLAALDQEAGPAPGPAPAPALAVVPAPASAPAAALAPAVAPSVAPAAAEASTPVTSAAPPPSPLATTPAPPPASPTVHAVPATASIEAQKPAQASGNPNSVRGAAPVPATARPAGPRPRRADERPVEPGVRETVVAESIEAPPREAAAEAPPAPRPSETVERPAPQRTGAAEPADRPDRPDRSSRVTAAMAAPPSPSPLNACRQEFSMARELCVAYECASSEYRQHPVCVRMHADAIVRHRLNQRNGP